MLNCSEAINECLTLSSIFGLIAAYYVFLLSNLQNVSIKFAKRLVNCVAHSLATATNSHSGPMSWDAIPPDFLVTALAVDSNVQ